MGRTIAVGEISIIASDCIRAIRAEEDVIELLRAKGFEDPVKTWYDVRRWIESNRAADYVMLPAALRIEIPEKVKIEDKHGEHTVKLYPQDPNPFDVIEAQEEIIKKQEEPKKCGRPKGWKKPVKEEAEKEETNKAEPDTLTSTPKIKIMKLSTDSFSFTRENDGRISINKQGGPVYLTIDEKEAKELAKAIPIVVGMLKS